MQKSIKDEIKFLENKLEKNPDSILFARLADAYLQTDRIEDAIELCENSIKKHPFYVTGHYVLGKCYLKKKLFDQAEKELKRVLLFDPKYIAAHRDYGELMSQIGWHNTCEINYKEILQIDPLNEKARRRFNELKEQSPPPHEHRPGEKRELKNKEVQEIEESIITGIPPVLEEEPVKEEFHEVDFQVPSSSDEYSPVFSDEVEDEKENLDLLEDIFRDDATTDLILEQDSDENFMDEKKSKFEDKFDIAEPTFLVEKESPADSIGDTEEEQFEGLDDGEMYSLLSDEKQKDELKSKSEPKQPPPKVPQKEMSLPRSEEGDPRDKDGSQRKKEKIVTPTLGEIYAAQQQYTKAIGVYEILRKKDPDNEIYKKKIEYLQKKLEESQPH